MTGPSARGYRGVVIGSSAGGMEALQALLPPLPPTFPLPLLVAQHLHKSDRGRFAAHLAEHSPVPVVEALDKQPLAPPHVYVAPANYHLLVERDGTLALSVDPKVNWARPAIDVLFESAARAWGEALIAVILSGANDDGARGMALVAARGGRCVAQDPTTAPHPVMPRAAIERAQIETILPPGAIGALLARLAGDGAAGARAEEGAR